MQERIEKILILLSGILLVLLAMTADASKVNPESQWANYSRHLSAHEPAYRFPHATCFKAAASRYDLPETLLLAVARGEPERPHERPHERQSQGPRRDRPAGAHLPCSAIRSHPPRAGWPSAT